MTADKPKRPRRDTEGRAFAGSQLQMQIYVNRRRSELDATVLRELAKEGTSDVAIEWVSPLEARRFVEHMDGGFLRRLELGQLAPQLRAFWPRSGPRWDGLALLRGTDDSIVAYLLAEGKSYPEEMFGSGCQSPVGTDNRALIDASLSWAKEQLRPEDKADWTGRLYQSANRLAHVRFLMASTGKPVWLLNLCFTLDPRTPWSEPDFRKQIAEIKKELGWHKSRVPHSLDVFLPARDRAELLVPAGPTT